MSNSTKRNILVQAIVTVAWLIVVFALRSPLMSPIIFALSLAFGILAFIAAAASVALSDKRSVSRATTEVDMLPAALSWGYLVLALIANSFFCLAAFAWITTGPVVAVNVVLIAALAIIQMGLNSNARQTEQAVTKVAAKVNQTTQFRSYVGQLIAMADDPQLKAELKALNDEISLSSNMSQPHVQEIEQQFSATLEAITNTITASGSMDDAVKLAREARSLWRKRNAALTSVK